MEAVKDDTLRGAAPRRLNRPSQAVFLRDIALQVMAEYESVRTKQVGVAAFLADRLHDNPDLFLAQVAKLEPKSVAVESTHRSLTVVMHVDGAPESMRLDAGPQALLDGASNATEQCLSDVVSEADTNPQHHEENRGVDRAVEKRVPSTGGSRPLTAPTPKVERPLPPHIEKPSECVSDFSKFKNPTPEQPPWHPNWHPVTRCPRCGVPVEFKGLVRNLPSYEHPVAGGGVVLLRQWARCPNQE